MRKAALFLGRLLPDFEPGYHAAVRRVERKRSRRAAVLATMLAVVLVLGVSDGCAVKQQGPITPPSTDKAITKIIFSAHALATEAKAAYNEGVIPQTQAYKQTINVLGVGANEARDIFRAYLDAKIEYQVALFRSAETGNPEEVAKSEAAVAAAFRVLQDAIAGLAQHIENVTRILGKG